MSFKVVLSGAGVVSPLGDSLEDFKQGLFKNLSGVKPLHNKELGEEFPISYAALIQPRPSNEIHKYFFKIAQQVTEQALQSVAPGLKFDAVIIGLRDEYGFLAGLEAQTSHQINSELLTAMRSDHVGHGVCEKLKQLGHTPPPEQQVITTLGACATSSLALGMAFRRIRIGDWKRVLVVAIDVELNPLAMTSYHLLGAMTTAQIDPQKASCPFSVERQGFVLGEAVGAVILESEEQALGRQAQVMGEILGASNTSDAWHLTAGREDAQGVIRAMEQALLDAGLSKNQIDYISAHGTSTPVGDRLECLAIKKTFGEQAYKIPISALKSQIGHTRIASGLMATLATCLMFAEQKIAPTLNFEPGDPDCDLDFVPHHSRSAALRYALINSFGFGGQNACLVLKKSDHGA